MELSNGRNLTSNPLILEDFAGSDIGQTVCFEIYQGQLYAVTNQVNFDEDEEMGSWVSFYVWACLPPTSDLERPRLRKIWRRLHIEEPINDTWTTISLRKDESTGRLLILECRREWKEERVTTFELTIPNPYHCPQRQPMKGKLDILL